MQAGRVQSSERLHLVSDEDYTTRQPIDIKSIVDAGTTFAVQKKIIPPEPTDTERLTELGGAIRFARLHGDNFRYASTWGWLAWADGRWERDQVGRVMRAVKQTVVGYYAEAAAMMESAKRLFDAAAADGIPDAEREKLAEDARNRAAIANSLTKWAKTCQGRAKLESIAKLAESEYPIVTVSDNFNRKPWTLNVKNGTIDLRTGNLYPHRRDDLQTTLCNVDYIPDATCPTWDKFLHRVMDGDEEMIRFLQRAIGYSLTGDVSEQKLFFLHGSGANGKSTFVNVILSLLGNDYATQAAPQLLVAGKSDRHPTEVADLYGKRLVASIEVEDGRRLAEELVKQLTGGDKIKARMMRQDFFQFDPTHKLWLVANHKPIIKGTDFAIWRRILLIPFDVTITDAEKDPQLPTKLLAESSGILAWAMRGCMEWQLHRLQVPAKVTAATDTYKKESDTFGAFLTECTVNAPTAETKASTLYGTYEAWCGENGERPVSGKLFSAKLTESGYEKIRTNSGVVYRSIGILA